jgi:hypothetical protein
MDLDPDTNVWMVYSDQLVPLPPGLPPISGYVVSAVTLPLTFHVNLLTQAIDNEILTQLFTDFILSTPVSVGTPNDPVPGDPFQSDSPVSGVPPSGGAGLESHLLTGVGSAAFGRLSNYRYFHVRK